MMPWAFIGFESISHSSKDLKFRHKNIFKILVISIAVSGLIYILVCLISISVFPGDNWYVFLSHTNSLAHLDDIPVFYVMKELLGALGLVMFGIALLAILITSLIGNMLALSNLIHSMSEDGVFPKFFSKLDKNGNPKNIIIAITLFTTVMLFFGRVLIGWIVDINTFCGIIVYSYVSVVTIKQARKDVSKGREGLVAGITGLVLCIVFAISVIANDFFNSDYLGKESIFIFSAWAVIGFIYYAVLVKKDKTRMFGNSMAALFGLFVLIICCISSWILKLINAENHNNNEIIAGIITSMLLLIATQIVFFFVFSEIKKREIALQDKLVLGSCIWRWKPKVLLYRGHWLRLSLRTAPL